MSYWENYGKSDEWYTPKYIFDALGVSFDMDVAHPEGIETNVPCNRYISMDSLGVAWSGFIWMNPPFGGRNGLIPWLDKFFHHGNGIALVPDRTSALWCQKAMKSSDAVLFVSGKIKFEKRDGSIGKSPSNGTILIGVGSKAVNALRSAEDRNLGILMVCHDAEGVKVEHNKEIKIREYSFDELSKRYAISLALKEKDLSLIGIDGDILSVKTDFDRMLVKIRWNTRHDAVKE